MSLRATLQILLCYFSGNKVSYLIKFFNHDSLFTFKLHLTIKV